MILHNLCRSLESQVHFILSSEHCNFKLEMNTADEISSTFSTQVVVLFLKLESRPDLCPVNEYLVQIPSLKIIYCKPFWP